MCVIDAGRSYKVVSPIPLARRWLGKLIRHWAIDRLWIRGIGPGCVAERSLPERVLDLNRGQTLCFEELDLLRKRRALRLDTEYQTLQKRESKTKTYRGVGKERNRVSDQVVSIHEGVSWHVPVNSFTPPSPATHSTFLPSSVSLLCCDLSSSPSLPGMLPAGSTAQEVLFSPGTASGRTTHTSQRLSHSLHAPGLPHAPLFISQP